MDEVTYKRVLTHGIDYTGSAAGAQQTVTGSFTFTPRTPLRIIGIKVSAFKTELATSLRTESLLECNLSPYGASKLPAVSLAASPSLSWIVTAATPKIGLNLLLSVGDVITFSTIAYGSFVLNDTVTVAGFIEFVETK